jgi:hypothetical protein
MIINFSKTEEIVFFRPNPYRSVHPLPADDIEQLLKAKVLGVILNGKFNFDSHLQFTIRQCSQWLYPMKLLRKQSLPPKQMGRVFRAIIMISRIQYAIQHGEDLCIPTGSEILTLIAASVLIRPMHRSNLWPFVICHWLPLLQCVIMSAAFILLFPL